MSILVPPGNKQKTMQDSVLLTKSLAPSFHVTHRIRVYKDRADEYGKAIYYIISALATPFLNNIYCGIDYVKCYRVYIVVI